jgi:hypothetical protein
VENFHFLICHGIDKNSEVPLPNLPKSTHPKVKTMNTPLNNPPPRLPDGKKRRLLVNAAILLVIGIFLAGRFTLAGDWNAATIAVEALLAAVVVFQIVLYIKVK